MTDLLAPSGAVLFSNAELACRCCGTVNLAPGFGEALIQLRLAVNRPMKVTSGCRCAKRNAFVGGATDSYHRLDLRGGTLAVDIQAPDGAAAHELVAAAIPLGWSVGIPRPGAGFVHLDRRDLAGAAPIVFGY